MTARITSIGLVVAASAAWAGELTVIGWTKDGRQLIYASQAEGTVVMDTRTGDTTAFEANVEGTKRFDLWHEDHPTAVPRAGRKNGAMEAIVETKKEGKWVGTRFSVDGVSTFTGGEEAAPEVPTVSLTMAIKRGAAKSVSFRFSDQLTNVDKSFEPWWSPDGKRVAWLTRTVSRNEGLVEAEFQVAQTQGPSVQVLAKDLEPDAITRVIDGIEAAGFVVSSSGEAKAPRTASVVYAAKGQEAAAAKIAAAVRGGATVDKLTWKPGCDVLVALGESARP